ncbi:hypothetical protein [Cryptosporangium minutisporangium]|uniref:Uncharacterized protein n=1 Tax=Cryptosporangium minutisporangium TaxID=113569 RepID=A0ABP6TA05_9ACTN
MGYLAPPDGLEDRRADWKLDDVDEAVLVNGEPATLEGWRQESPDAQRSDNDGKHHETDEWQTE